MSFPVQLYFVPMVTLGLSTDSDPPPTPPPAAAARVQMTALLFTDNASPTGSFAQLNQALLYWAASGYAPAALSTSKLDASLAVVPEVGLEPTRPVKCAGF